MITPTTGGVKVNKLELMQGLPFALKFFNDDHNMWISPSLFDDVINGKGQLRYVVMSWRTDQKTIEEAVQGILDDINEYGIETGQIIPD